ncbi:baseplate J/gp47 family protein [Arsenophonus sp. PmNCSU2021_1]|uniref:baseplate J/gp47 family protein n=1 Tax=Arsenophonus sp. PmNCSU2021_1 TaxID=3118989 RepID=UPI002FF35503
MQNSGFSRPTLPQLIDTIRGDLLTRFNEDSVLRRLDAEVYARVQAAAIHTLYGYIDYLARNILPDLADEDWLTRHGNIKRCPRKGAPNASGFVRWEGVQNALSLPADTEIHRDDGQIYTTTAPTTSASGVLRVPVVAKSSGQAGNCEDGIALRLATPITGLSSTGYADNIRTGADIEDLDSWRQRIMARWYDTPQGGADSDYVRWAKEVLGISRAWTHRHKNGIGTVGVMVASDDVDHPAPTQEILTKVREHILPLAPVAGSGLTIFPVTAKTVAISIALSTDTPEIRAAVIAEIKAFLQREGEPGSKLFLSRLAEAISLAAGEIAHRLIAPTADIELAQTEVPVLGEVTWAKYKE